MRARLLSGAAPIGALMLLVGGLTPAPARASGNEHVVDDAGVETPGHCHLESWVTLSSGNASLVNLSPACTPLSLSRLEIGGAVQRYSADGEAYWQAGPTLKWTVLMPRHGVSAAVSGGALIGHNAAQSGYLILPVTVNLTDRLDLNINAGVTYVRGRRRAVGGIAGAQMQWQASQRLSLMGEVFGQDQDKVGGQIGVRWTGDRGRMDIDLVAGRYVDGVRRNAVSLGLTFRR